MHYYQLRDRRIRDLVADFDYEAKLRSALREVPHLDALALARGDGCGQTEWVAIESFVEADTPAKGRQSEASESHHWPPALT